MRSVGRNDPPCTQVRPDRRRIRGRSRRLEHPDSLARCSRDARSRDTPTGDTAPPTEVAEDTARLRRELDEARHRAERAEAIAAERERTIEVLQQSLRMLERGHSDDPPPPPEPAPEPPAKRGGLLGLLGF